ncbi:hypothetical protein F2Q69_00024399 [Brassica cretica]|uniref:Uncharacterized protein n=1 Tax=Brassica cretica TaxID=69181 RepID=A0A8S9QHN7_BRACR|nr:hypothetical protein F2Q69_00024399 [Brassica cretica]
MERLTRIKKTKERKEGKRQKFWICQGRFGGQTDPDRADILWKASSVSGLKCCLECLVNPTVRSSPIELKFGRGVVDWFILDLYGGISLWLPESL